MSNTDTRPLVIRLRDTPNWRRESYGSWKDCVSEYDRAPFEAAEEIERLQSEVEQLTAEVERRKVDPITRLHNICEAISEERDGSEFSREEWGRIDAENANLRAAAAAVAQFIGGEKDRFGRPDPVANESMRKARARVLELSTRYGVQGGHRTYLDQCAALLRASLATGETP